MIKRPSHLFLALLGGLVMLSVLATVHSLVMSAVEAGRLEEPRAMVRQLGLSDLALFTESRYGRHIAMADLHSAFQDHPVSFDHFPTGSFLAPPRRFGDKAMLGEAPLQQERLP